MYNAKEPCEPSEQIVARKIEMSVAHVGSGVVQPRDVVNVAFEGYTVVLDLAVRDKVCC